MYPSESPFMYCGGNPILYIDPTGMNYGDYYNESGKYLGTDGIDDKKIYQTTDQAWNKHIASSGDKSTNTENTAGAGTTKYDNLKASTETDYLGETNEFGLLQITKMGNDNIVNNTANEDSYSYRQLDGTMSEEGKHGDDWATPEVAAAVNYAVKSTGVTIVVNDASAYNPATNLGHKSHKTGEDIDIRYITANGYGSTNSRTLSAANKALNASFVKALKASGFKDFLTDGSIKGTKKHSNHTNHMHFGK
jgi:hypothetical protein